MSEQINQTAESGNPIAQEGERTFTQAELDTIINKRLADERRKAEAAIAEKEREFLAREHKLYTAEVFKTKNLPEYLLEAIRGDDKATFDASMAAIERFMKDHKVQVANELIKPGETPKAGGSYSQPKDTIRQEMGLNRL